MQKLVCCDIINNKGNKDKGLEDMMAVSQQRQLELLFKKYELLAVYLFGSRTDGSAKEESDYDFGLLLRKTPALEEAVGLETDIANDASGVLCRDVDVIVLNSASIEQRFLVISRGKLIYSADDHYRTDFEDQVIRDYLDFRPFLEEFRREVREAIKEGDFFA